MNAGKGKIGNDFREIINGTVIRYMGEAVVEILNLTGFGDIEKWK